MFGLEKTKRTEKIETIQNNLSNLTTAKIIDGLEIKAIENGKNQEEKDKTNEENNKIPEESNKKIEENDKIPEESNKKIEENDKIPEEKSDKKGEIGWDNHDTTRQEQNDT